MKTKIEIKDAVKSHLPVLYQQTDSIEYSKFKEVYKNTSDYAYKYTEPFLKQETIRYQSILLYISLLALSVYFFDFSTLKIFDQNVEVNRTFMGLFSAFICIIIVTFATKSFLDYKIKEIACQREDFTVLEAVNLLKVGEAKYRIDSHYWQKIINVIYTSYNSYLKTTYAALGTKEYLKTPDLIMFLDIEDLKKLPELKPIIDSHDKFLNEISNQLNNDRVIFEKKVENISKNIAEQKKISEDHLFFLDNSCDLIRKAFNDTLEKWFNAKDELESELSMIELTNDVPLRSKGNILGGLMKKSKRINKAMIFLEVVLPILFAVIVLIIIWIDIITTLLKEKV